MELDNSTKLSLVDQIKYLMDSYAGRDDQEWLFLCQCQSRDFCQLAGSEMGLKFMNEAAILTGFRGYIGMTSGKERRHGSESRKCKQSKKPDENDSLLKRPKRNITADVQKETGASPGKRRKQRKTTKKASHKTFSKTSQKVLDSNESRVFIGEDHGVSSKPDNEEQILSQEIKIEIEPGEFEKVQIEKIVDRHSDYTAKNNFDGLENEEALKSGSLTQSSDQELSLVKTEQIEIDHSGEIEQSNEINKSASQVNQSGLDINQSAPEINQSVFKINQSVSEIDQSVSKINQSVSEINQSENDLSSRISEIILNVRETILSENQDKHQGSVSDSSSSETDEHTETDTKADDSEIEPSNNEYKIGQIDAPDVALNSEDVPDVALNSKDAPYIAVNSKEIALKSKDAQDIALNSKDVPDIALNSKDVPDIALNSKEDITCTICSKTFKSSTALRGHQNAHSKNKFESIEKFQDESRKYECSKCGAKFWTALQLQHHESSLRSCRNPEVLLREKLSPEIVTYQDKLTGEEIKTTLLDLLNNVRFGKASSKLNCIVCQHTFKNHTNLENHIMMRHSNIEPHVCEFCNKTFKVEHNMNLHKHSMHKDLLNCVTCELCGAKYLTKEKLQSHKFMSCPKRKQIFDCEICDYSTNMRSRFEQHLRRHTTTKSAKFMCQICNKTLSSSSALNYHIQAVHSSETPFKCKICEAVFKTRTLAKMHQQKEHEKPGYHCDICNRSFSFVSYFKIHMQCHLNGRDFVCEVCGRSFMKKSSLGMHQKTHSADNKSYKCSMCDASFIRGQNLRRHEAIHRPSHYICDICGHTFKLLDKLQTHRRRHSETYTKEHYTCKICDINCGTVTRYKTHIVRFHPETVSMIESTSSLRFHKCNLCPKQFNYSWTLKKHLEVHDQKSVCCPKCFHLFSTDKELETHMKKRHRPKKLATIPETVKSALKSKLKPDSVKCQKKTKSKRKAIPNKVKNKGKIRNNPKGEIRNNFIKTNPQNNSLQLQPMQQNNPLQLQPMQQNNPLQLQPKVEQNDKEYTAVKASSVADPQSLSPYVGTDINGQVLPLVNNLMVAAFIRGNDVGTSETYAKMITPPFFPNL